MNKAKEKSIKSLEGFRLNVVLKLDIDYDVYKKGDIGKAIDIAIKETAKAIFDDIQRINKAIGFIEITGGQYLLLKERHLNTQNTDKEQGA